MLKFVPLLIFLLTFFTENILCADVISQSDIQICDQSTSNNQTTLDCSKKVVLLLSVEPGTVRLFLISNT